MAFRYFPVNLLRKVNLSSCHRLRTLTINSKEKQETHKKLLYLEDPDTFGTLVGKLPSNNTLSDKDDLREEEYLKKAPLKHQKLTIKQYSDLIKEYLKYSRLKEAIDVLEVRMLTEDRVKPENYIYNILIGACADFGYTKKAFKLFNDMKRRALKPTGATYTSLFHACCNSPWSVNGLKNAVQLRNLMLEKNIEPNITIYNSMIKAFGRCGDINMAFKIVDEMMSKKIKIRVHTFNHLLQACINDKDKGLKHALLVWRKMLLMREKPNIYSFNLMLKCVKDCNLGNKEDMINLITSIHQQSFTKSGNLPTSDMKLIPKFEKSKEHNTDCEEIIPSDDCENKHLISISDSYINQNLADSKVSIEFVNNSENLKPARIVPNLLARTLNLDKVLSLEEVYSNQDKFAVVGCQEDFLKEMDSYSVKPDVKTFTQMLFLMDENTEVEDRLIESMKSYNVLPDIGFYNMLIKKRCYRKQYDSAFDVMQLVEMEIKRRKKMFHPLSRKRKLKLNVMTYGVLALACTSKDSAHKLLSDMEEKQLKVNIEILGSLLRQGTANNDFEYVKHIMNIVQEENVYVSDIFLRHLESFDQKCKYLMKKESHWDLAEAYKRFQSYYSEWLAKVNLEDTLKIENPWQQFKEKYPETFQRSDVKIKEHKRYYKPKRRPRPYAIKI